MRGYVKPEFRTNEGVCESVYAASGQKVLCRFQREGYNSGADVCQSCSATNGENGTGKHADTGDQYYEKDFKGCPDNMPEDSQK